MSETIYGSADVAQLLRVTRAAVSNYRARYDDMPEPAYITTDGRPYWTAEGMAAWQRWSDARKPDVRRNAPTKQEAWRAVEELRQQINPS